MTRLVILATTLVALALPGLAQAATVEGGREDPREGVARADLARADVRYDDEGRLTVTVQLHDRVPTSGTVPRATLLVTSARTARGCDLGEEVLRADVPLADARGAVSVTRDGPDVRLSAPATVAGGGRVVTLALDDERIARLRAVCALVLVSTGDDIADFPLGDGGTVGSGQPGATGYRVRDTDLSVRRRGRLLDVDLRAVVCGPQTPALALTVRYRVRRDGQTSSPPRSFRVLRTQSARCRPHRFRFTLRVGTARRYDVRATLAVAGRA
jgi:hypothetical protein